MQQRAEALRDALQHTDFIGRRLRRWPPWYERSFLLRLDGTLRRLQQSGYSIPRLLSIVAKGEPRPWAEDTMSVAVRMPSKYFISFSFVVIGGSSFPSWWDIDAHQLP